MPDEHWAVGFEHASVTADNRADFTTHMAKFATPADAVADGFGLAKLTGKPFKMPESLDKLPDDAARADFTSQAHKVLGIRKVKSIDDLKDVNLKDGLPDGSPYDEGFATAYKQFVVDEGMNSSDMPKNAKFFNTIMAKLTADGKTKAENDAIAAATSCDEALIAHPDIGSKENLLVLTEQFKRAMTNHMGLSADEVAELGEGLALSTITKNPVLQRVMLKAIAPLAATATNEGGAGGGGGDTKPVNPDAGSPTYVALGWSSADEEAAYKERNKQVPA